MLKYTFPWLLNLLFTTGMVKYEKINQNTATILATGQVVSL